MITPAQNQARLNFIGASDAAAAIGLNPWKTPLDLWLEKTGQTEPFCGNEQTFWGNVLEPVVAARLAKDTGLKLRRHGMTLLSRDHPYMGCHLDYKVTGEPVAVEIKTGGYFTRGEWGESGSDEIPDSVLCQVTHQMIVTDYKKALIGVLLGGQEFRHYSIDFDHALAEMVIEKEKLFWHCVTAKTPPPPSNLSDLKSLYPRDIDGQSIIATPQIIDLVEILKSAKAANITQAANIEALEFQLKAFIAENSILTDGSGKMLATWKAQVTNRIDTALLKNGHPDIAEACTKATSSRVLRIK